MAADTSDALLTAHLEAAATPVVAGALTVRAVLLMVP
jgi:hypothetical protein